MIHTRLELIRSAMQNDVQRHLEKSASIEEVVQTQDGVAFDAADFETARELFDSLRTQNSEFDVHRIKKTAKEPSTDSEGAEFDTAAPAPCPDYVR
jgi:hypothetical protein